MNRLPAKAMPMVAAMRDGEADVERRLARLGVGPHVADRIERIDDPQARGHRGEQHAQRLDREGDRQAGQHVEQVDCRPRAAEHLRQQRQHRREQRRGAERASPPRAGSAVRWNSADQERRRHRREQRDRDQCRRRSSRPTEERGGRLAGDAGEVAGVDAEDDGRRRRAARSGSACRAALLWPCSAAAAARGTRRPRPAGRRRRRVISELATMRKPSHHQPASKRRHHEIPLRHEADGAGDADEAEAGDDERRHGQRHGAADAGELLDLAPCRRGT